MDYITGNYWLNRDQMKINATFIASYLLSKGCTINAICGMLGNMERESSINPGIWQSLDPTRPWRGYGLVQWTPSTKYTNWCSLFGYSPPEMPSALERILYEAGPHPNDPDADQWGSGYGYPAPFTFMEFLHSNLTPYELGFLFHRHYERSGDPTSGAQRGQYANTWYTFLTNNPPPEYTPYPAGQGKKTKIHLMTVKKRMILT